MLRKLVLVIALVLSINIYASTEQDKFLKKISTEKVAIVNGEKEAEKNIETEFVYSENAIYKVHARMNNLMAIVLNPDEKIMYIGGGDSARWIYSTAKTGSAQGERDVIYIKPTSLNLETNFIINTDKRSYNLVVLSGKRLFNPIIKWRYTTQELIRKFNREEKKKEEDYMTLTNPENLNYKYTINKSKYEFSPSTIFDDGKKTFLVMDEKLQELPSFYIREGKKLILVNYRVKNNYLIIDRTFREGVLRIGKKQIIIKNRG